MDRHPRVALVLGAGGPVGFAFHAGVLSALDAGGWDARGADLVIGTSIGAVVGGLLRSGMAPDDLLARAAGEPLSEHGETLVEQAGGWPSLAAMLHAHDGRSPVSFPLRRPSSLALLLRLARDPARVRPGLVLAGLLPTGDVAPGPIVAAFDRLLGEAWPERDLWVCATDLDRGERVVFGAAGAPPASVGTAVAASTAVPSVFQPVVVAGRRYVDGGTGSPVNTDLLAPLAADLAAVVVSLPMGVGGNPERLGVDLPGRWLNHQGALRGLEALRRAGIPILMVEPGAAELRHMGYDAFDLTRLPDIALHAREAMVARWKCSSPAVAEVASALGLTG